MATRGSLERMGNALVSWRLIVDSIYLPFSELSNPSDLCFFLYFFLFFSCLMLSYPNIYPSIVFIGFDSLTDNRETSGVMVHPIL